MATVGAYEAKTNFSKLLDRVSRGETITITRNGVEVARLVPAADEPVRDVAEVIESIRAFRKNVKPLKGITIRELIEEGRRF